MIGRRHAASTATRRTAGDPTWPVHTRIGAPAWRASRIVMRGELSNKSPVVSLDVCMRARYDTAGTCSAAVRLVTLSLVRHPERLARDKASPATWADIPRCLPFGPTAVLRGDVVSAGAETTKCPRWNSARSCLAHVPIRYPPDVFFNSRAVVWCAQEEEDIMSAIHIESGAVSSAVSPAVVSSLPPRVSSVELASSRAFASNPNHHLWKNGRLWWIAFTLIHDGWRQERVRQSLGTDSLQDARRRR